ncbi:MAG: NAD(P)-binding protein [Actinobacteria bacterium]|nr:NAD(P)-binding protein [Actinomycetota bacterium]
MEYDVVIIGAGLSGLTAGSLLAKRGLKVAVIDKSYNPGGSCGAFKRDGVVFDQGSTMLFGFGENGFNAHRFVFNCLEEPIQVIKHEILYCVNFKQHKIKFHADIDTFIDELSHVFPSEKDNIRRFYKDLETMYRHVMVENPAYATPDETDFRHSLKGLLHHPLSYIKFISYLNMSTHTLLDKYFEDPELFKFFDKLTSTYCYTTVKESPAVLGAIMFVDNHVGGSYYPAGSTLFLPGKLEKVIEENNGDMLLEQEVIKILFEGRTAIGVELESGEKIFGRNLIYSGTVWNLYGTLVDESCSSPERIAWAREQIPTYPSVVLYACVDKHAIPEDTAAVEMLVGNPDRIDESEVTVYITSIDDRTVCDENCHVVIAIGPSFESWSAIDGSEYLRKKEQEKARLTAVLERRFPGFRAALRSIEIATPKTIERYTNKNNGAVAGPKQMLGQHLFRRLHTKSDWPSLYCCGESTVMGTGTPTVTTSGISAANAILKKVGLKPFEYSETLPSYVEIVRKPFTTDDLFKGYPEDARGIMRKASLCQYCEKPRCSTDVDLDIRGIMRRVTVGNFSGAKKAIDRFSAKYGEDFSLSNCEARCIQNERRGAPVAIQDVVEFLRV